MMLQIWLRILSHLIFLEPVQGYLAKIFVSLHDHMHDRRKKPDAVFSRLQAVGA